MSSEVKHYAREMLNSRQASRDELIVAHLPFIKYIVGRMAIYMPSHIDQEDLASTAIFGLINAAEKFDPSRGVQFKTYAEQRIRGTIIDELRAQDWVSRKSREKYKKLEQTINSLCHTLGRQPSEEEISEAMNISIQQYHHILECVHGVSFVSLNENWEDDEGGLVNIIDSIKDDESKNPQNTTLKHEFQEHLGAAIDTLPEKERLVVTLYYVEELTLKEIGDVLGVTEGRVSQLHTQAIARLRCAVSKYNNA